MTRRHNKKEQRKTDYGDQKQHKQHKDHQNKKTEKRRKTTVGMRINFLFFIFYFFIYCRLSVLILVVFVLFLLSLRFGQISPLAFFRWFTAINKKYSQIKKPHLKMIPIKDKLKKKKFGTDPTLEDQIRIYKIKKSTLDRPSGPVAQRLEALSLYGSRWALSEDSGFKSYPSPIENDFN